MDVSRRRLLRMGCVGVAAGVAGCSGGDGGAESPTEPGDGPSDDETATKTPSGPPTDCEPLRVEENITSDTTWGTDCGLVELTDGIGVQNGATLTIEPGVTVTVSREGGLTVENGGTLEAVGTAANPIRFEGASAVPGHWGGIVVRSTTGTELSHVTVAHGGRGATGALRATGRLSLTESTVERSVGHGLVIEPKATVEAFGGNTFRNNERAGVSVHMTNIGALDADSDYAVDNGADHILVTGGGGGTGEITTPATWPGPDAPFLVQNRLPIQAPITVEAGATFLVNKAVSVDYDGSLTVEGTVEDPVRFDGQDDTPGSWRGIRFDTNDERNRLRHTTVANAGVGVIIDGTAGEAAVASLTDCTFEDNELYGLQVTNDGSLAEFARNNFTNNGVPVRVAPDEAGTLDAESTYAGDNENNRIEAFNADVTSDQTWSKLDVPYLVEDVGVKAELTVDCGTTVMFQEGARLYVDGGDGKLVADGDSTITFTGQNETPGLWKGIEIKSGDAGNVFDDVDIGYARIGVEVFDYGNATVTNSSIHDTTGPGIEVSWNGQLSASGNTFENVEGQNIDRE